MFAEKTERQIFNTIDLYWEDILNYSLLTKCQIQLINNALNLYRVRWYDSQCSTFTSATFKLSLINGGNPTDFTKLFMVVVAEP